MEKERENKNTEQPRSNSENYTIFHALVETMVKKERRMRARWIGIPKSEKRE